MAKQNTQETIIAHGVRVEGEFVSQGDVLIEGEVSGTIQTASDLRVGDQSKIRADVSAKNALVAGEIRGNISVEERIELTSTARIIGDIAADVIAIAAGAQVNGKITMDGKTGKAPKAKAEQADETEE